jgi:hypothetical protein
MYFPWIGIFEQIRLADVFVFYDDVQFTRGFINRVQYKTPQGTDWITVPLCKHSRSTLICELQIKEETEWRRKHLSSLKWSFQGSTFSDDALTLASDTLYQPGLLFAEMLIEGIHRIRQYLDIGESCSYYKSSELDIGGYKGDRIKNIVKYFGGECYITGHDALNYLDHDDFEKDKIEVRYMDYKKLAYPQMHGEFTPFVSILDLIANVGPTARTHVCSDSTYWRDFINESN